MAKVVRNGEVLEIPDDKVGEAEKAGFRRIDDERAAKIVRMREASTLGAEIQGAAEAAASGASFGLYDTVATEVFGADAEGLAARREGKGAFELAGAIVPGVLSGGSGVLGTAARLTPAGAAARLGSGIARRAGGGAIGAGVGAATEGALQGAGATLSEAALGGHDITAERLAANVASNASIGGLLGVGLTATGGVFSRKLRPKAALDEVATNPAALAGEAASQAIEKAPAGLADTRIGRVARKVWKMQGAADDDLRTVINMLPDAEGRRLIREGPDAVARSRDELGVEFKSAVDRANDARNALVRQTGGDTRIGNAERLMTGGENATAPRHAKDFLRAQLKKVDDELGDELLSAAEKDDLLKVKRSHQRALREIEKQGVTGAEAFRRIDRIRQEVGHLKQKRSTQYKKSGLPDAEDSMYRLTKYVDDARGHTVDETIYGRAGKEHAENLEAWSSMLGAERALREKSTSLGKLFEKGADNADISPLMTVARGRAGETKRDLFFKVFEQRKRAFDILKKNHDLPEETLVKIREYEKAVEDMEAMFKKNGKRVQQVEALYRIRQQGESGFSPSNVGAQGAAAIGSAAGFSLGGVPGAVAGGIAGAATKPFTTLRWLAAAGDAVEKLKLRETGLLGGIGAALDGKPPKSPGVSKSARRVARGLGASARRAALEEMNNRRARALKVRDQVNAAIRDPSTMLAATEEGAFEEAPNVTRARHVVNARALAYLKSIEPRTYRPAFSGGVELVDPAEIDRYEQGVQAVSDPYGTLEMLWSGGMTLQHTNALDAVYPLLMDTVRQGIYQELGARERGGRAVDHRARSRLGTILRIPLSDAMRPEIYARIQAALTPMPAPEGGASAGFAGGRGSRLIEDEKLEDTMTESQRRMRA